MVSPASSNLLFFTLILVLGYPLGDMNIPNIENGEGAACVEQSKIHQAHLLSQAMRKRKQKPSSYFQTSFHFNKSQLMRNTGKIFL